MVDDNDDLNVSCEAAFTSEELSYIPAARFASDENQTSDDYFSHRSLPNEDTDNGVDAFEEDVESFYSCSLDEAISVTNDSFSSFSDYMVVEHGHENSTRTMIVPPLQNNRYIDRGNFSDDDGIFDLSSDEDVIDSAYEESMDDQDDNSSMDSSFQSSISGDDSGEGYDYGSSYDDSFDEQLFDNNRQTQNTNENLSSSLDTNDRSNILLSESELSDSSTSSRDGVLIIYDSGINNDAVDVYDTNVLVPCCNMTSS